MKKIFLTVAMFYLVSVSLSAENIRFDNNNFINIDIPVNWTVTQNRGTPLPEMGKTFDIRLTPPSNEKGSLIITVGKTITGGPLTREQLDGFTQAVTTNYLQGSVEKRVAFIELPVRGGSGKYSIFTDASLVNKRLGQNDFLYAVPFFVNYNNGCFVYATGLTNNTSAAGFQNMIKSVSSIEPSLTQIARTPPIQIETNRQGTIIGNAVNKLKLLITSGNLKRMDERSGGGQSNPGYFYFQDTRTQILISGWFEPIEKFEYDDVRRFWASQYSNGELLNAEFRKIDDWEIFLFDLPLPAEFRGRACNSNLRANLLKDDTWIDLHLSITSDKSSAILRNDLIEYIKTIRIIN